MFNELCMYLERPEAYTKSKFNFWNDEYISKQLLQAHLDTGFEGASRSLGFIDCSVEWIITVAPPNKYPKLLDLGCGPGLYAERFAKKGYNVTGIDFSKCSIDYAQNRNDNENLQITYLYDNYLDINYDEDFDMVTLIYCDYGALSDKDRIHLINKVYKSLKPGGILILDVFTINKYNNFEEIKSWKVNEKNGFWSSEKYISIQNNCKYTNFNSLEQTVIITEKDVKISYIWNHYFSKDSFISEVESIGFKSLRFFNDVAGEIYSEDNMTMSIILEK